MRSHFIKILGLIALFITLQVNVAYATDTSSAPEADNITVTNNVKGKADTVYVSGLTTGDVVKVYKVASNGTSLGTATATSSKDYVTIKISQLGATAGSVYVSITSKNMSESSRTQVDYDAEAQSDAPDADNITVTNNVQGKADTVYVSGLATGDVVKVYKVASNGTSLGTATATSSKDYVTIKISQLGATAGSVYLSITSKSMLESSRTQIDYDAEEQSDTPDVGNITVTNNAGGPADTVYVTGLVAGDIVKLYKAASKGTSLGTATVASGKIFATVSISQLGSTAGSIYVSVTSKNKLESSRTQVDYDAEEQSDALDVDNITVTNNATGTSDTVYVTALATGDIVKVYKAASKGTAAGTATATSSTATITISQLGTTAGSIYVSVISTDESESGRTQVDYDAEEQSEALDADNITVSNNAKGTSDTVYVTGLAAGDIVKVYKAALKGTVAGTATATSSTATITISQLGTTAGSIYVSVISTNESESSRTQVDYDAEAQSTVLDADNIIVTNNLLGTGDTVCVTGLATGDIVKAYNAASKGTTLGTATATSGTATITIAQLGSTAGSVYVSLISTNKSESSRTQLDYDAEAQSAAPTAGNISVTNNATGTADTVYVIGLTADDVVTVYNAASKGSTLGTATVTSNTATITITQLGTTSGSIYVSVTGKNKSESSRTQLAYDAETQSGAPVAGNITIVNNVGVAATVTVTGLVAKDIVNVYDSATNGTLLGTGTVSAYSTKLVVDISQLVSTGGSVYVSVTSTNKLESGRTEVTYDANAITDAPETSSITVVNNYGISDTVSVTGLTSGDVINVYNAASGGTLLGSGTVSSSMKVTISITQLGAGSGSVYVSNTTASKTESSRTIVSYTAEEQSETPQTGNITIKNYASGTSDTIKATALLENAIVNIYNAASGGKLLGSATVTSTMTVTISIAQLGSSAGNVYISVTSKGYKESERLEVAYKAESTDLDADNIAVINNAGISDTVYVTELNTGDLVKVYSSDSGGSLLGSATVSSNSTSVTISMTQIGATAGSIYISVTNSGRTESNRTEATFTDEPSSTAPYIGNIIVTNNYGISDTVTVTDLTAGDVINVYDAASNGTLLGTATVSTDNTKATVTIADLGSTSGNIYVSVTSKGKAVSGLTQVTYIAEQSSVAPYTGYIDIVNNPLGTSDTVTVTNLAANDIINVYNAASGGNLLGYAVVLTDTTKTTVIISQLGTTAGNVYVTVTSYGKKESNRTNSSFVAE